MLRHRPPPGRPRRPPRLRHPGQRTPHLRPCIRPKHPHRRHPSCPCSRRRYILPLSLLCNLLLCSKLLCSRGRSPLCTPPSCSRCSHRHPRPHCSPRHRLFTTRRPTLHLRLLGGPLEKLHLRACHPPPLPPHRPCHRPGSWPKDHSPLPARPPPIASSTMHPPRRRRSHRRPTSRRGGGTEREERRALWRRASPLS